jgi:hypothetical protein
MYVNHMQPNHPFDTTIALQKMSLQQRLRLLHLHFHLRFYLQHAAHLQLLVMVVEVEVLQS